MAATPEIDAFSRAAAALSTMPPIAIATLLALAYMVRSVWLTKATRKSTEEVLVAAHDDQASALISLISGMVVESSRATDTLNRSMESLNDNLKENTAASVAMNNRLAKIEGRCGICPNQQRG